MALYEVTTHEDIGARELYVSKHIVEAVSADDAVKNFPYYWMEIVGNPTLVRDVDEEFPMPVPTREPLTVYGVYGTYDDFSDVGQYLVATYFDKEHAEQHAARENRIRQIKGVDNNDAYPHIVETIVIT